MSLFMICNLELLPRS